MYGLTIAQAANPTTEPYHESLILSHPLGSLQEVEDLKKKLMVNLEGTSFYFSAVQQALKVEGLIAKFFALIKALAEDLYDLPFRFANYDQYRKQEKASLPLYQYLKSHDVSEHYLDHDRFMLIFYAGIAARRSEMPNGSPYPVSRYFECQFDLHAPIIERSTSRRLTPNEIQTGITVACEVC